MSKRAGAVSAETREAILCSAQKEFAMKGFQNTSLRQICAEAGVTTGAVYFFFEGKDDLFASVIAQVTKPFMEYMQEHYQAEHSFLEKEDTDNLKQDLDISVRLIDFYFQNKEIWDIIRCHLDHSAVRKFLDEFVDVSTEHYLYLLTMAERAHPHSQPIDWFAVHQYVHMQADTMLTLISHGFDREELIQHAAVVTRMLRGAFNTLLSD